LLSLLLLSLTPLSQAPAWAADNQLAVTELSNLWMPGPHTCKDGPPHEPWLAPQPQLSAGPVLVGGVRYQLTELQMVAICQDRQWRLPNGTVVPIRQFRGYRASVAVDGDFGQLLQISVTGRSSHPMQLKLSCGSLQESDSGTRFIIQREQRNEISCQQMEIELLAESSAEPTVELSIMLTEEV